jgi:hypothetical protein
LARRPIALPTFPGQTFYSIFGQVGLRGEGPSKVVGFRVKVIFTIRASVEWIGVRLNAPNPRSNGGSLLEHSLHDCGGTDAMRFIL